VPRAANRFNGEVGSAARDQVTLLPLVAGVYRFRDDAGRVLYLGRATSLRRRVASYWGDLGGRAHLRRMVARVARVEAVACDSVPEAAWLERNLLQARFPPWNRDPAGGQESEVWIRLSDSARAPGLAVTHQPPSRDLARIHGVSAADRPALVAALAAVLDRDPAAVAAVAGQLAERRGAAAQTLAFEVAARLQEEIEALGWVTAPQRVTSAAAADHDACGWSDGLLVRFSVRGGRLTGWTQRACGEASAHRHLAATAPHWQEFAQRNADLAASLAHGLQSPTL
jgi:excinuclease ABC subunit C